MAPGFGGTRDNSLLGYALGFAARRDRRLALRLPRVRRVRRVAPSARVRATPAPGLPRCLAAARRLPGVDPERDRALGVSYSGGHVVVVAAQDQRVAATISLTPAMDGIPVLIQLARNGGAEVTWSVRQETDCATRCGR